MAVYTGEKGDEFSYAPWVLGLCAANVSVVSGYIIQLRVQNRANVNQWPDRQERDSRRVESAGGRRRLSNAVINLLLFFSSSLLAADPCFQFWGRPLPSPLSTVSCADMVWKDAILAVLW